MRSGARREWTRKGRDARRHDERRAKWNTDQRIFYEVFRPAVQHIRDSYWDSNASQARARRLGRHEYALLKEKLPPNSELGFDEWLAL